MSEAKPHGSKRSDEPVVIPAGRFKPREVTNNDWTVDARDLNLSVEDLGKPATYMFASAAGRVHHLHAGDIIRITLKEYWAEVMIRLFQTRVQQVQVLRVVKLDPLLEVAEDDLEKRYQITFDDRLGWTVVRKHDRQKMGEGRNFGWRTKDDVKAWLRNHATEREPAR